MYDYLAQRAQTDPASFLVNWVQFDLAGKEASENVWDLLYDYCDCYKKGRLSKIQNDPVTDLLAEVAFGSYAYPMGPRFLLEIASHGGSFLGWVLRKRRYTQVLIDAPAVSRITGTLEHFRVMMGGMVIDCGPTLTLVPAAAESPKESKL